MDKNKNEREFWLGLLESLFNGLAIGWIFGCALVILAYMLR